MVLVVLRETLHQPSTTYKPPALSAAGQRARPSKALLRAPLDWLIEAAPHPKCQWRSFARIQWVWSLPINISFARWSTSQSQTGPLSPRATASQRLSRPILTLQTIIVTRWAELISKIGQFYLLYIQYELTSVLCPSSARLFSAGRAKCTKDDARGEDFWCTGHFPTPPLPSVTLLRRFHALRR